MNLSDSFHNFFTNGVFHTIDHEINKKLLLDALFFQNANQVIDFSPKTAQELTEFRNIQDYIVQKYLSRFFNKVIGKNMGYWEGIDVDSRAWHNDYLKGNEFIYLKNIKTLQCSISCFYYGSSPGIYLTALVY